MHPLKYKEMLTVEALSLIKYTILQQNKTFEVIMQRDCTVVYLLFNQKLLLDSNLNTKRL